LLKFSQENDFYHDMTEHSFSYVHFFNFEKGRKTFEWLKKKTTSQYNECYEITYEKNKGDSSFEKIYSYLKNPDYLDYIYLNLQEENYSEKKEKVEDVDDEGFTTIKKKGK